VTLRVSIAIAAILVALVPGCRKPSVSDRSAAGASRAKPPRPAKVVVYDAEGVRLPQEDLPLGTPVPVGLSKVTSGRAWVRYSGAIKPAEVVAFYTKYLTLPEGTAPHEVGSSVRFLDARPKQPGNPGRPVEVRVVSELGDTRTGLLIIDAASLAEKAPPGAAPPLDDPADWKPSFPGEKLPSDLL